MLPRLEEVRCARGLSRAGLAARAGVGTSTILRLERGLTRAPRPHIVRRLCAVLGVLPDEVAELRAAVQPRLVARSRLRR